MSNHSLSQDGGETSNSSDENNTNHPQNKNAMMEVQALHNTREHGVVSTRGTFAVIPSSNPNGAFRAVSLSAAPLSSGSLAVVQHGSKSGQQQQHCTSRLPARGCDFIANLKLEEEIIRSPRANASPAHSSHGSFENVLFEGHVAIGETEEKIMLSTAPAAQRGSDSPFAPSSLPGEDLDFLGGNNEDTDDHPADHIIVTTSKNALHVTAPSHPRLQPQESIAVDGSDTTATKELVAIAPKETSPSTSRLGTSTLPTADSSVGVATTALAQHYLPAEQSQTQEIAMSILNNSKANADQTISPGDTSNTSSPLSKGKRKRSFSGSLKSGQSSGRWTREEHQAFLEGLKECGREWKKVAMRIPSRTSAQIRSHAQKYFAKVQRDQEHDHHSMTPSSSGLASGNGEDSPAVVVAGEGGLLTGSTVATYPPNSLTPSVQRNVERIIADPRAAQQEVENTLEALRLRYRQLQQRLEERRNHRQHRREGSSIGSQSSTNNIDGPPPSRASVMNIQNPRLSRKQFLDSPIHYNSMAAGVDENSSVSSNISSVAASRGNLGNEEIIALQVLGDDLPRGDSSVEDTASATGIATVELDEASTTHGMNENTTMDVDEPPVVQESKTDESPVGASFEDRNQGIPNHDKTC